MTAADLIIQDIANRLAALIGAEPVRQAAELARLLDRGSADGAEATVTLARRHALAAIVRQTGSIRQAAALAGVDPGNLSRWLRESGITDLPGQYAGVTARNAVK